MSTTALTLLINSTAESNISMRNQIKQQQLSLLKLEQKVKQRQLGLGSYRPTQLKIPPGKMIIKAKGMVMRVRNEKAILDELEQTKHRRDSDDDEDPDPSPKFDSKKALNLIIQSQVQNTPPSVLYESGVTPTPPSVHSPPRTYPPPPGPVYYQQPPYATRPTPVVVQKQFVQKQFVHKHVQQPVHYVEEYVEEPPTVYKVRKPYSRPYPEPVIVYEDAPPPPHDHYHRSRPVEYRSAPYPSPPRHHDTSPRYSSHHSPPPPPQYRHRTAPVLKEEEVDQVEDGWNSAHKPAQPPSHHTAPHHTAHYVDNTRKRSYPTRQREQSNRGLIKHDIRQISQGQGSRNVVYYKVLVSNLHPSVSLHDIEELFSAIDTVEHIQMLYPGVAEVTYVHEDSAAVSVERYHNRELDGQPMQICYSAHPAAKRRSEPKTPTKHSYRRTNPLPPPPALLPDHHYNKKVKTRGREKHLHHPATPHAALREKHLHPPGPHTPALREKHLHPPGPHTPALRRPPPPPHSDTESSVHSFTVTM